jgi:DNA-binding response OmpR family regulator
MTHENYAPLKFDTTCRPVASPPLADTFVVVLEDDPDAREFLTAMLGLHGAIVVGAESEREALEFVGTGTADVLVGGAGGSDEDQLSLIRRVRARVPERGGEIPALSLTSQWSASARSAACAAGYQECLAWPFAAGELVQTVRRLAEK